jgi:hypothetical protein
MTSSMKPEVWLSRQTAEEPKTIPDGCPVRAGYKFNRAAEVCEGCMWINNTAQCSITGEAGRIGGPTNRRTEDDGDKTLVAK